MVELGYVVLATQFSKKVSDCVSGDIVKKKDQKYFILDYPSLSLKEKNIFLDVFEEIKRAKEHIKLKSNLYFFLKNYCIENEIMLRKDQRENIILLLEWEILGNSVLQPLLNDNDFEEIVINGKEKPLMLYHHNFGWLTSNIYFTNDEKIKNIINRIASHLGRQLSFNNPILNATLLDGSRLNASMDPIAFSGINVTIRKFKQNPLTPLNIIHFKTINSKAMALLWLVMQTSSSLLICGNTGSGKTTTLNSLFCFLPKDERIVLVEETPEIVLPQEHKVKLNTAEQLGIGLEKLIENTFRMRPDRVIVGEIRSKNEAEAFVNTMLAGQAKGSYATFHAESATEAINRLKSFGIENNAINALDLIIVQKRITKINPIDKTRREIRKITQICEIDKKNSLVRKLFEIDNKTDVLKKINESIFVKEKIMNTYSCEEDEFYKLLKEKEELLEKLSENISFNEFFEIIECE